jgi:hypothetical protein
VYFVQLSLVFLSRTTVTRKLSVIFVVFVRHAWRNT